MKVFVSDGEGHEMVPSTQAQGEYFGEMVLDEGPRSASIMTLERSRFLVVPKAQFRSFVELNPAFARRLIEKADWPGQGADCERQVPRPNGRIRSRRAFCCWNLPKRATAA